MLKKGWVLGCCLLSFAVACSCSITSDSVNNTQRNRLPQASEEFCSGVFASSQEPTDLTCSHFVAARETVMITVFDQNGSEMGGGSGFIIQLEVNGQPTKVILTNIHVIDAGPLLLIQYSDGTETTIDWVWREPSADVALLLPTNPIATSGLVIETQSFIRGERLVTSGHPQGIMFITTEGVAVGIIQDEELDQTCGGPCLFADAQVNPGNSGGPIVDSHGRVRAIVLAYVRGTSYTIAIPFTEGLLGSLTQAVVSHLERF